MSPALCNDRGRKWSGSPEGCCILVCSNDPASRLIFCDHYAACLDEGVYLIARFEAEFFHRFNGDGRGENVAPSDVHLHFCCYRTFRDVNNLAFDDVSCTQLPGDSPSGLRFLRTCVFRSKCPLCDLRCLIPNWEPVMMRCLRPSNLGIRQPQKATIRAFYGIEQLKTKKLALPWKKLSLHLPFRLINVGFSQG